VLNEIGAEFSDLSFSQGVTFAVRLLTAAVLAAPVGWERGHSGKSAGLRTHILVAVSAAALAAVAHQAGLGNDGISRALQGLVAGLGFLGAGCILKAPGENHVHGLTTAAGILLTASLGIAAGLGRGLSAVLIAVIGWLTLTVLIRFEGKPPHPGS
jgi:putative Mg2+ transporter-C (MgtC) family protein